MRIRSATIETRLTPIILNRIREQVLRGNFEAATRLNRHYTVYEKSELVVFCESLARMQTKSNTTKVSGYTVVFAYNHGRLAHYFHFLLGLFVPLLLFLQRHSEVLAGDFIFFPDSALFNKHVHELLAKYGLSGTPIPRGLDSCICDRCSRKVHLEPLDIRLGTNKTLAGNDIALIEQFSEQFQHPTNEGMDMTVIDRTPPEPFYNTVSYRRLWGGYSIGKSGADRRAIPNLDKLTDRLAVRHNVKRMDLAGLPMHRQIAVMRNTRVCVAQHGAALGNIMWMRPGSAVLELIPPELLSNGRHPILLSSLFENLAISKGVIYKSIVAPNKEAIDLDIIEREVQSLHDVAILNG